MWSIEYVDANGDPQVAMVSTPDYERTVHALWASNKINALEGVTVNYMGN